MARTGGVKRTQQQMDVEAIDRALGTPEENVYGQASQRLKGPVPADVSTPLAGSTSASPTDMSIPRANQRDASALAPGQTSKTQPVGDPVALDVGPAPAPAAPAATPSGMDLSWGDTGRLRGFNTNEWGPGGDPGYDENSFKNNFGKIASRYEAKPSNLPALAADPDFQKLFPGASVDSKDRLIMPDGSQIDVLIAADPGSDSAQGWAWQPLNEGGPSAGDTANMFGAAATGAGAAPAGPTDDRTLLEQIMASVDAMAKGNEDPMVKQQIDKLLSQASPQLQAQLNTSLSGATQGSANTLPVPAGVRRVGAGGAR